MIENGLNGNWMIIPCNPHLQPPPHDRVHKTTTWSWKLAQNESDFSLFSGNHVKLIEEMKNLELGSTSHAKMNKIHDDKGKRSVEYELRD
ncbi:hypothetical protein H5410_028247 [Solanum commersonii]|uniref:Uncharacterized protein n=1 Tax=Solanum commersonii TaxID=4109 RepID=A0A9J5Z1D7_SOLCO|nr:hypothetical protein H5410_028247 [Solanum commersonii]